MAKRRGHGEGSVNGVKDAKGKEHSPWTVRVTTGTVGGKQQRVKRIVRGRKENALAVLRQLQTDLDSGISPEKVTVEEHFGAWFARQRDLDKAPATLANYEWAARHFLPAIGSTPMREVDPDDIERLLKKMKKNGASRSSMARVRSTLMLLWNDALGRSRKGRRLVQWNPVTVVPVPSGPKPEEREFKDPKEIDRLFEAITGDEDNEALWMVMACVGLRPGEATALRWEDVDFDAGTIAVAHRRVHDPGGGWRLEDPKTKWSARTEVAAEQVMDALRRHRVAQKEARLQAGSAWEDHDFVFTTSIGTPLDRWMVRRRLAVLTQEAGFDPPWHPVELRHLFNSIAKDAGVPLRELQEAMGHAPGSTLSDTTYNHSMQQTVGAAVKDVIEKRLQ